MSDEEKKILIDEDWKSQVEAEKQAAAERTAGQPPAADGQPSTSVGGLDNSEEPATTPGADASGSPSDDPPMPPASVGMLMSSLATEALISMGQFPHPATGETIKRLNQAQYLIDTLDVLKKKTAGNLTDEEATALDDVLHQLRMAFIASK